MSYMAFDELEVHPEINMPDDFEDSNDPKLEDAMYSETL